MAKTLKIHPLADMLPRMLSSSKEYKELKEDIKTNGMKVPMLVTKDGATLIDGRHRWYVAHDLGLKLSPENFEAFNGNDAEIAAEIVSRNIMRRHLNEGQRAALVLKIRGDQLEKEAKERQKDKSGSFAKNGGDVKGSVAAHVAKEAKVSQHKAEQAIKAKKAGLLDEVVSGKTKASVAAKKAPKQKRPKKVRPFDEIVWEKYQSFLKRWSPTERREVEKLILGWLKTGKK